MRTEREIYDFCAIDNVLWNCAGVRPCTDGTSPADRKDVKEPRHRAVGTSFHSKQRAFVCRALALVIYSVYLGGARVNLWVQLSYLKYDLLERTSVNN